MSSHGIEYRFRPLFGRRSFRYFWNDEKSAGWDGPAGQAAGLGGKG
jgi:hypothetical protein